MVRDKIYAAGFRNGVFDVHQLDENLADCWQGVAGGEIPGYKIFHVGTCDECSNACDIMEVLQSDPWCKKFHKDGEPTAIRDACFYMLNRPWITPLEHLANAQAEKHPLLWAIEIAAKVVNEINDRREKCGKASLQLQQDLRNTVHARAISNNRPDVP